MSQFVEDGWHGGSTATTSNAPTVDDTVKTSNTVGLYGELTDALVESLKNAPSASTAAKGDTAKNLVGNSETMDKNAANAFFNDTINEANEKINNASSDEEKERLQKELEEKLEAERKKWEELLAALNSSQNEINTITQVISTSEKIYDTGKKNYEESDKKIADATKEVSDSQAAWNEAKGWMSDLQNAQDALSAAENKLLNATTEAERQAAQAELDAERDKWQALLDKVLAYSEKEIDAARKLGDKALEKDWTEKHDLLKSEGDAVNKSLDSLSSNMNDYFNKPNSDGSLNNDYLIAARLADAQYNEAAAALKQTLEDMKTLQSALIAYARHVLEEAQRLLELASSDLNMSLDQAEKARDMAQNAWGVAKSVYDDAIGTPYEAQAKQLLDTADEVAQKAQENVERIQKYLQEKNITKYTDDEFADKRLKEIEDYLASLGYSHSVNWTQKKGDDICKSIENIKSYGVKENVHYKVVGKFEDGTLFVGNDIRFYTIEKKHQYYMRLSNGLSSSGVGAAGVWLEGGNAWADVYRDITYHIVEVDGDVYVQGITYANQSIENFGYEVTYMNPWAPIASYVGSSAYYNALGASALNMSSSGGYEVGFRAKIFSREFIGY